MATANQRNWVRYDLATDDESMPDAEIDDLYVRAGTIYPSNAAAADSYVRLLAIDSLWVAAAKRTDYKQNQSSESLGQLFYHLQALRARFRSDLDLAIAITLPLVRFGALRRVETKLVDYPNDFPASFTSGLEDISRIEE